MGGLLISIRSKALCSLALISGSLLGVAGAGFYASDVANDGLTSLYNDRVQPLRDLKLVADSYAVSIVDTSHKVRAGRLSWDQGVALVTQSSDEVRKHWVAYSATQMNASERELARETQDQMRGADAATEKLLGILKTRSSSALEQFVVNELYRLSIR